MNRQLIQDEKSTNPMDVDQLRGRMQGWLESNYHAVLFERADEVIGYALYRFEDETFGKRRVVYLRQFFVGRAYRGQGWGQQAFGELRRDFFREAYVKLEVLTTNSSGLAFWQRLGFEPYAVTMALK